MKQKILQLFSPIFSLPRTWLFTYATVVILIPLVTYSTSYVLHSSKTHSFPTPIKKKTVLPTPTHLPSNSPSTSPSQTISSPNVSQQATPTPTPTTVVTQNPTAIVSNPPIVAISYPSENQSITFTSSSQTFCVVDIPSGGNTIGLMRRQNINNQGWTNYASESTLCFTPNAGSNTFSLQYKNSQGDESSIYTRNFTFNLQQNITVSLHGELYSDLNCNNTIDSGESGIANVSIMFMQPNGLVLGTAITDGSGNYSFSKDIAPNTSLSIQPTPNDHTYTFQTPAAVTLNSGNPSATINLAHCP